jgi:hypothetical protein
LTGGRQIFLLTSSGFIDMLPLLIGDSQSRHSLTATVAAGAGVVYQEITMILKSIRPFSCAKVLSIVYLFVGLIIGLIFSGIGLIVSIAGRSSELSGVPGLLLGVGAIIFFPIFYAVLGFIGGLIISAFYNLVAGMVGGIEMDLDPSPPKPQA